MDFDGALMRESPLTLSLSPWERGPGIPLRIVQGSPLHPHPLADADTLICKLALASLGRGTG